jgi:DNA replication protein DnaC
MSLAELDFIPTATNIVFIGPTGVGKSGLATGLLLKALQNGYRALFIKAQDLFDDPYASLADRSSRKLIDRLARVPLLCIDEMGYLTLRPEQSNIFFKLMEERYRRRASIITTNLDYDDWLNFLGNKHMVTACLVGSAISARPSGSTVRPSANPRADRLRLRARDIADARRRGPHPRRRPPADPTGLASRRSRRPAHQSPVVHGS